MDVVEIGLKLALDEYRERLGFDPCKDTREEEYVSARYGFMAAAKVNTRATLSKIGGIFFKDHATVLHSFKRVNNASELHDDKSLKLVSNYKLAERSIRKYRGQTDKVVLNEVEKIRLHERAEMLEGLLKEKDDKITSLNLLVAKKRKLIKDKELELEEVREELKAVRTYRYEPELKRIRKLEDKFFGY